MGDAASRAAARVSGSLLGLALGDALGFVTEAAPAEQAAAYVRDELRAGRAGERARPPWRVGQYSDDTQLARELLRSIQEQGAFDPRGFADHVAQLVKAGRAVGAGPATRATAERLLAGVPWHEAATAPPYAGNGAAMRVGPLGALYAEAPELLARLALAQAVVTHRDARAVAGAVAIAGAAALASRPGPVQAVGFVNELVSMVETVDRSVATAIAEVLRWLRRPPSEALLRLREAGLDPFAETGRGISGFVTAGVAWSLYAFLRSPDDYWETICTAIEVGGDTDTLAAMAGSVSGARLGRAALPPELLARVTDAGEWGAGALAELAATCAAAIWGGGGPAPLRAGAR